MGIRTRRRFALATGLAMALAALLAWLCPAPSLAQDVLIDRLESSKQYLVRLTGSAGKDNFTEVTAVLNIGPSPEGMANTYTLTVSGWPRDNGINTFVWVGDDTRMSDVSTRVECKVVNSALKQPNVHFYYLSPRLLKLAGTTQHDKEDLAHARKVAQPTRIAAEAGELTLNFAGGSVSGNVWLNGYDPVGRAFVRYQANLYGELNHGLESTHRVWKYD